VIARVALALAALAAAGATALFLAGYERPENLTVQTQSGSTRYLGKHDVHPAWADGAAIAAALAGLGAAAAVLFGTHRR
jgi:hypothetical protein